MKQYFQKFLFFCRFYPLRFVVPSCVVFLLLALFTQRRIAEGAAMLRTKGEAGTGNVVEAVRHARSVQKEIKMVRARGYRTRCVFFSPERGRRTGVNG